MSQTNVALLLEPAEQESWIVDIESKPEIYCMYGPYISQRITKDVYGHLPEGPVQLESAATTHHDAHWDHPPGRRGSISLSEVRKALKTDGQVKDNCTFVMRGGLKMREEREGYLISENNTAYFVNNIGTDLLKLLENPTRISDVRLFCRKLGISERAGIEFFRRLVTFGLCRPI